MNKSTKRILFAVAMLTFGFMAFREQIANNNSATLIEDKAATEAFQKQDEIKRLRKDIGLAEEQIAEIRAAGDETTASNMEAQIKEHKDRLEELER